MQQNNVEYIRLAADLQSDSIVDGPGLRTVLWTQGCSHRCKGCQNPQTWSHKGGALVPLTEVYKAIDELEYQTGFTFSGGDPMYQVEACNKIAEYVKNKGMDIWVYTGFTYEEVLLLARKNNAYMDFLKKIDVLVDGRFILEQRDLSLLFRGSRNQRLIDVPKTLESGKVTLLNEYEYNEEKMFEREPMYI